MSIPSDFVPDIAQDEPSYYDEWPDHPGPDCKCLECVEGRQEQADLLREEIELHEEGE